MTPEEERLLDDLRKLAAETSFTRSFEVPDVLLFTHVPDGTGVYLRLISGQKGLYRIDVLDPTSSPPKKLYTLRRTSR